MHQRAADAVSDMEEKSCPECGCPIDNEKACPECGYPIQPSDATMVDYTLSQADYNEVEPPYSPFSRASWFFKTPVLLSKYPRRGDFAKKHHFLGWLFNPWHISFQGNGNRAAFDTLNNFFLLCNLVFKTLLYPILWGLFKMIWWYIALVAFLIFGAMICHHSDVAMYISGVMTIILYSVCGVFSSIVYLCGWAESLRRYISPIYGTFMRICKRFSISITKSVKTDDLNK